MVFLQAYTLVLSDYNAEGIHCKDRSYFLETVKIWERDFRRKHPHCFADHFFANTNTMKLIHGCLDLEPHQMCGMELIDGEVDMEAHMAMESYGNIQTIYALGSSLWKNLDEPLLLIIDNRMPDGLVYLKYIPECGAQEPVPPPKIPIHKNILSLLRKT